MEQLKLYWLGHPQVELKGRPIKLETRKAAALLAYVSLSQGECPRELLATMFWPEGSQQKALANLRRTLSSLNSSLPGWIEADRETISLKRNAKLCVDMHEFHQLLSQLEVHGHAATEICDSCLSLLVRIVDLYRGDFLEGLNLTDTPNFDEWQFFKRDGLRQEFAEVLQRLARGYTERGQLDQAILYARRWLALERLHEPACRLLMELYARSGQRTAALHQYEELVRLLHEQIGQSPEPETRQLYEQIRGREETKQVVEPFNRSTSFPLLKTKLYIPTVPLSKVVRSHLLTRLDGIKKRALTLISAPAGFGKTTLLAEWIAQTSLPVAWLALDNDDNDPYRFLSYLIAALESIQENVGLEARQIMQSPQIVPAYIILVSLINELGTIAEPYVLVLDDYQFITEHAVHETMAYLFDHLPSNMHLIIATRADPPIQLGRLRAHDQMMELRTQDLRFTAQEATEFLNAVMRLGLSANDIEILERRTEGWVVGLKMAALSMQGRDDASGFIRAFSGSHRYVLDYLVEEVLKRQPAHIQTFLLETSILEKLNGSLCDALMTDEWRQSRESGQAVLEDLEKSNLFVIPLDENKQWYRYHHLFADLLRARLQQFTSERAPALHLKASLWYEEHGLILDAIGHAITGRDFHHASDLIEKTAYCSLPGTAYASLQNWIERIPEDLIFSHPWICIAQAYVSIARGKLSDVNVWLQKADEAVRLLENHEDIQKVEEIRNNIAILQAYLAFFAGDMTTAIKQGVLLLEKQQSMSSSLRAQLYQAMGEFYLTVGEFDKSRHYLWEAITLCKQIKLTSIATISSFRLGGLLKSQGKLCEAEKVFQDNRKHLHESGLRDSSLMGKSEIGLGDILRERGDFVAAEKLLLEGLRHSQLQEQPYDLVFAYVYLSQLEYEKGNVHCAMQFLEQADKLFQTSSIPPTVRFAWEYHCVRLWILNNNCEQIERWLDERHRKQDIPVIYWNELILVALSRVFLSKREFPKALNLLDRLAKELEDAGRYGRLIEILNLQALTLRAQGNVNDALIYLEKSLCLAEPEGYVRIFLDEGEPMLKLLQLLKSKNLTHQLEGYVSRLLEASTPV